MKLQFLTNFTSRSQNSHKVKKKKLHRNIPPNKTWSPILHVPIYDELKLEEKKKYNKFKWINQWKKHFSRLAHFSLLFFLILMKFNSLLGNGKASSHSCLIHLQKKNRNTLSLNTQGDHCEANDEEVWWVGKKVISN